MQGLARLFAGVVPVALLAACTSYVAQPLKPEDTAAAFAARSLTDPGLRRFIEQVRGPVSAWPPPSWDFDSLTLAALYFSPELDVARARLAAAQAAEVTAGERPNPGVSLAPAWVSNAPAGVTPWVVQLALDIPVRTGGKRAIRIAEARNLSEAARLRLGGEAWGVRSRLRVALVDLWQAQQSAAVLEHQEAAARGLEKAAESRLSHGEVGLLEVTQARRQFQDAALALAQARRREAETRVAVAGVIGVPVSALASAAITLDFTSELLAEGELPPEQVRTEELLNRSDLLASLAEYAASEAALHLEIARQYPDIHLGPGYTFDKGENQWELGIGLALPIMNRNQGPIAEAQARRREDAARFVALQAAAIGEVSAALASYRGARDGLASADALLAAANATLATTEKQLAAGEVDRLALLTARVERDTTALAGIEARAAAQRALGRIEDAVQRPLFPATPLPAPGVKSPQGEEGS